MISRRKRLLATAGACAICLGAEPVAAQVRQFSIPSQPAARSIVEFGRQADVQLLAPAGVAEKQFTQGVQGSLDAREALARMIAGTDLRVASDNGKVITLARASSPAAKIPIVAQSAAPSGPPPASEPAPAPAPAPQVVAPSSGPGMIEEVVVTATRQVDTVNRVPLSVSAVTQRSLDQQGVKSVQDLSRSVPSVQVRTSGNPPSPDISIRGVGSSLGAATTGIYLDDTPLQKRALSGAATNGTPVPQLFDLDRVEVLRGPQGTLFGSGSEGGTIRFITPAPSLTRYSSYGRAEVSDTEGGGMGYEVGAAVGGPIIEDKLGFRGSFLYRHTGGYIDHISIYDGHTIENNTNLSDNWVARLAVTWAPTENLRITPALYSSFSRTADQDLWWYDIPKSTSRAGNFTNTTSFGSFSVDFPNSTSPSYSFGPYEFGYFKNGNATYYDNNCGACTAYTPIGPSQIQIAGTTINGVVYPARTINVPGQQTGANKAEVAKSPRTDKLTIPSLTIDYDFGGVAVKSITSYVKDKSIAATNQSLLNNPNTVGIAGPIVMPWYTYRNRFQEYKNWRDQYTQEIRFSSTDKSSRFTWVAGGYYTRSNLHNRYRETTSWNQEVYGLRGIDAAFATGYLGLGPDGNPQPVAITCDPTPTTTPTGPVYNCVQTQASTSNGNESGVTRLNFKETELAAFGEANYLLTDKLKLTVGLRVAHLNIRFDQTAAGANSGPVTGFTATAPSAADPDGTLFPLTGNIYSISTGKQSETPVTPKFGVSYQANARNLFYATAAKGFRAGGVNTPAAAVCTPFLKAAGYDQVPVTYDSDSVWSYEIGAKMRVLGMQVNSSIFHIKWKDAQTSVRPASACSAFIENAGSAVSDGFDVQVQTPRYAGFSFSGSVAYADARYTSEKFVPAGYIFRSGDPLPGAPKWQYAVSGQYDTTLFGKYGAYARVDYQYSGKYRNSVQGRVGYNAATSPGEATHFVTARVGVSVDNFDVNVFAKNLTNSKDILFVNAPPGYLTATTFRPREIGLQVVYRH